MVLQVVAPGVGRAEKCDIGENRMYFGSHACGSVLSTSQNSVFLGSVQGERLMPGDAIVMPEKLTRFFWSKELREWSQIFYQFALGVVGLKVLKDL